MFSFNYQKNKILKIDDQHFLLLVLLNYFGYLSSKQLDMLWSVINKKHLRLSRTIKVRWQNQYHLLNLQKPNTQGFKHLLHPVYCLTKKAQDFLKSKDISVQFERYSGFNSHNEQSAEVIIQTLYALTFKVKSSEPALNLDSELVDGERFVVNCKNYPKFTSNLPTNYLQITYKLPTKTHHFTPKIPTKNQHFVTFLPTNYLQKFTKLPTNYLKSLNNLPHFYPQNIKNLYTSLRTIDLRSFNLQLGLIPNQDKSSIFIADRMISVREKNQQKQIFLELDNRTESNLIQIEKMINYCHYAQKHPDKDILVSFALTDGSLPTKKYPKLTNCDIKIANLAKWCMQTLVKKTNEPFFKLYQNTPNLQIVISPVSQAHIDIADFILDRNFNSDFLKTSHELASEISKNSDWNVKFIAKNERYNVNSKTLPIAGHLVYDHEIEFTKLVQPVIWGSEHSLTTLLNTYAHIWGKNKKDAQSIPSITIFPTRERYMSSIIVPQFTSAFQWTKYFSAFQPMYVQPQYSYATDPYLENELTLLKNQYESDIYSFYKYGKWNKKDWQLVSQNYTFIPRTNRRKYTQLQHLANKLNHNDFIRNLKWYEVPIEIYQVLFARTDHGEFSTPLIITPDYLTHLNTYTLEHPSTGIKVADSLFILDKLITYKRTSVKFNK